MMCKHIAVKAHLFSQDMTGKWPMVSIAKTTIGICGISIYLVDTLPCWVNFYHIHCPSLCTLQYPTKV